MKTRHSFQTNRFIPNALLAKSNLNVRSIFVMKKSILLLLFGSLLSFSCSSQQVEAPITIEESSVIRLSDMQLKNAEIEIENPQLRELSEIIKAMGSIDLPPTHRLALSVPIGGIVTEIDLLPGMKIKKGQELVTLRDMKYLELKESYLLTNLEWNKIKSEFTRYKILKEQEAVSEKQFKEMESTYLQLEIKRASLKSQLNTLGIAPEKLNAENLNPNLTIYSPVDGYVSNIHISKGEYVNPDRPMLELIDPSDIHLTMNILESDLGKLAEELPFNAVSNTFPDKIYPGHILLIGKDLDENRMVEVHAHFEKEHPELLAGMSMNVTIHSKKLSVLTVSESAVIQFGAVHYLFIQKGTNEFEGIEVEPGISENGFVEIKTKLDPKSKVVSKGSYTLLMKWKNAAEE
jgi:membrane fusion protein, heavy metal efflux system